MNRKDLGLLVLILVVGTIVAIRQAAVHRRRSTSPTRPTSSACSACSRSARASSSSPAASSFRSARSSRCSACCSSIWSVNYGVPWPLAVVLMLALGALIGLRARPADHQDEDAALHRHAVRAADLSRHRPLLHRRRHRRLRLRRQLSGPRMADDGPVVRHPAFLHRHDRGRRDHVGGAAPLGVRAAISSRSARTRRRRAIPASAPTASSSRPMSSAPC